MTVQEHEKLQFEALGQIDASCTATLTKSRIGRTVRAPRSPEASHRLPELEELALPPESCSPRLA